LFRARPRRVVLAAVVATAVLAGACSSGRSSSSATQSTLVNIQKQRVLRAGIRFDNPPHSFIDSNGNWVGFDVDIADALARQLGVKLEKVKVDELTRISYLQNRTIDVAVASMSQTIKRVRQVDFSQTYFCSKQTFLVKKGVTSLADLYGKTVGVDRGSSALGNWKAYLKAQGQPDSAAKIVDFTSKDAAAQAVSQGAIAGWAEDYEVLARYAAKTPGVTVLNSAGIGVKLDGVGIRFNDSPMRDEVNFALQRIVASGEYDQIYDKWF